MTAHHDHEAAYGPVANGGQAASCYATVPGHGHGVSASGSRGSVSSGATSTVTDAGPDTTAATDHVAASPLGTTTRNSSSPLTPILSSSPLSVPGAPVKPTTAERRRLRTDVLDVQRKAAPEGHRLRQCLLLPKKGKKDAPNPSAAGDVTIVGYKGGDGCQQVTLKGAGRCADRSCSQCGPKIADGRAKETAGWLAAWESAGGSAFYWCLTVPRKPGEDPEAVLADLRELMRVPFAGSSRERFMKAVGCEVYKFEGIETTTGFLPSGQPDHHAHLHGLFLAAHPDTAGVYENLFREMAQRLFRPARLMGRALNEKHAFVLKPLVRTSEGKFESADGIAGYVHKGAGWGVDLELHGEAYKLAKGGGSRFNAAQMLVAFGETGDVMYRDGYREVLRFIAGKKVWVRPQSWAKTLAFATRNGVMALNGVRHRQVMAAEAAFVAIEATGEDLANEVTDDELANAEVEGGIPFVTMHRKLFVWLALRRGGLGSAMESVRVAPVGERAHYFSLALRLIGCPEGLLDWHVDVENGEVPFWHDTGEEPTMNGENDDG